MCVCVCVCVCLRMCVCVFERKRGRKREKREKREVSIEGYVLDVNSCLFLRPMKMMPKTLFFNPLYSRPNVTDQTFQTAAKLKRST